MHNEQKQQQHRTWHVNLISAWQLQSHPGAAVACAARYPPAGLAADTRRTAVCRDDTPACEISSRSAQCQTHNFRVCQFAKHYRRSTPRGHPPAAYIPSHHPCAGISMGILLHAADLVTLPTFTPPATHQAASYKPTTSRTNHPGFTGSHTATTRPRWYHSISDNGRPNMHPPHSSPYPKTSAQKSST